MPEQATGRCNTCKGSGTFAGKPCGSCNGNGALPSLQGLRKSKRTKQLAEVSLYDVCQVGD